MFEEETSACKKARMIISARADKYMLFEEEVAALKEVHPTLVV